MRVVAWNCREGFASKIEALMSLAPDVAIVSECSPLAASAAAKHTITWVTRAVPLGNRKHLGVLAWEPWCVGEVVETPLPWCLVARIAGPTLFTVVAVWPVRNPGWSGYPSQLNRVVREVLPGLTGPVVLGGDLNAPLLSTWRSHVRNVSALAERGLTNAFAASRGVPSTTDEAWRAGVREPTFFQGGHRERPFHLDHVFVPYQWRTGMSVELGSYDEWIASGLSDHVPVVVDVVV